ncbi:uncharacterized protein [Pagrus major]|uniref:uncharacterized protein n=1 Tax=Pagrus major TaxID=143350 RepID=UPI003CC84D7F
MSDRYEEIRRESGFNGNYIPLGRQLPRTPPLLDVTKHLDFCNADEDCENMEAGSRDQEVQNRTFDFSTPDTRKEHTSQPDDPNSMLKGMKGYQLTQSDLEFIKKMQQEKLIKKLQSDLEEVQKSLKKETMAAELVYASREKAQAELKKFPSCEELTDWVKLVLKVTSPSAELADVDTKSLLAMVTKEDVQRVVDDKRIELARMGKMVANKRKKDAKERAKLEKQIISEQVKIQGLMSQLSDLKSELAQQEDACKSLEMQINTQEAPEIKVEAEEAETSEEQAAKGRVQRRGKERKKAVRFPEKLHDTTNQTKSTRSKPTDGETGVKEDDASETVKTKQKSGAAAEKQTKSVKAARGPQKKVEETQSNPQESEQTVRGRRKPPRALQTTASQPKNQSKVKMEEAASSRSRQKAAVEEAQSAGLRRSKRIASRS